MTEGRFDYLLKSIDEKPIPKEGLVDLIYREKPEYSYTSCLWVIGSLVSEGKLIDLGFGRFIKAKHDKWEKRPVGKKGNDAILVADSCFQKTAFCIYETNWINDLTGMAGGEDALIVEVEKRDVFPFFMEWKKRYRSNVLLNPKDNELSTYFENGSVIIKPLFSKSPVQQNRTIRIEKAIVDLCCDKHIKYLYFGVNLLDISAKLVRAGNYNLSTVLNYAKRRNIYTEIRTLLMDNLPADISRIIKENSL